MDLVPEDIIHTITTYVDVPTCVRCMTLSWNAFDYFQQCVRVRLPRPLVMRVVLRMWYDMSRRPATRPRVNSFSHSHHQHHPDDRIILG